MNNILNISKLIEKNALALGGVLTTADIANLVGTSNRTQLPRILKHLEASQVIAKFCRGFYVVPDKYDAMILSQKIFPQSYLSFETVLAKNLVIGSIPQFKTSAVKIGRGRNYKGLGLQIEHLSITQELFFGFDLIGPLKIATSEKSFLDCLYFYLRGRQPAFNIYEDINYERMDLALLHKYLSRYKNDKFVTYVKRTLDYAARR